MTRSRKKKKAKGRGKDAGPPHFSRFVSERMTLDIQRLRGDREYESVEDYQAFVQPLMGEGLDEAMKDYVYSDEEKAQNIAFDAMDARSSEKAMSLAEEALELDPECVDALVTVVFNRSLAREARIEALEDAVEVGFKRLGKDFFEENKGHFWGLIETRPYMRVLDALAGILRRCGHLEKAIKQYQLMLELNPNDNQGVRYPLLGCYLATDHVVLAEGLIGEWIENGEESAFLFWGEVLLSFLMDGELDAAIALDDAWDLNPFVEDYLTGKVKRRGTVSPDGYAPGSEEEAILCLEYFGEAWQRHPRALEWLRRGGKPSRRILDADSSRN